MQQTEGELRAGRLVDAYGCLVKRLSWTYLRSTADAQDVFQTVMLKLIARKEPFASDDHERAWVIRTTINDCKNLLSSAAYRTTVELDECLENSLAHATEDARCDEKIGLAEALDQLSSAYREAVYLHYYEGYSIGEIARITGCSADAVAKRLSRARAMLRNYLEG